MLGDPCPGVVVCQSPRPCQMVKRTSSGRAVKRARRGGDADDSDSDSDNDAAAKQSQTGGTACTAGSLFGDMETPTRPTFLAPSFARPPPLSCLCMRGFFLHPKKHPPRECPGAGAGAGGSSRRAPKRANVDTRGSEAEAGAGCVGASGPSGSTPLPPLAPKVAALLVGLAAMRASGGMAAKAVVFSQVSASPQQQYLGGGGSVRGVVRFGVVLGLGVGGHRGHGGSCNRMQLA